MSDRSDLTAVPAQLIVRLAELPTSRKVELGESFVSAAVASLPMRAALENADATGLASASLELYSGNVGVFARGRLDGHIAVACSRCIEPMTVVVDDAIAVSFLPASEVPEDDPDADVEVTEDDEDLFPYQGETIDLTDLFRERLILAVPFAPICSDSCKGLCSVCGVNLNETECGCDRDVVDPRLASLRDIKLPT